MNRKSTYIALRNGIAIPFGSLDAEQIKTNATKAEKAFHEGRPPEHKLRHIKILNDLAHVLGFPKGFAGFRDEQAKIDDFCRSHGMMQLADLTARDQGLEDNFGFAVTHRQIADRLFHSGIEVPKCIFTGFNFDFKGIFNKPRLLQRLTGKGFGNADALASGIDYLVQNSSKSWKEIKMMEGQKLAHIGEDNLRAILLREFETEIRLPMFHFLGDLLTQPSCIAQLPAPNSMIGKAKVPSLLPQHLRPQNELRTIIRQYFTKPTSESIVKGAFSGWQSLAEIFRTALEESEKGWLEVLPYSKGLIFLKAPDGRYDFVHRQMRDTPPSTYNHPEILANLDAQLSRKEKERFEEWYYFQESQWQDLDLHQAELYHYSQPHDEYPGELTLLYNYLKNQAGKLPADFRVLGESDFRPTLKMRFNPGNIVVHDSAKAYCKEMGVDPMTFLGKHLAGDHGLDQFSESSILVYEFKDWIETIDREDLLHLFQSDPQLQKGMPYPAAWLSNPKRFLDKVKGSIFSHYLLEDTNNKFLFIRTDATLTGSETHIYVKKYEGGVMLINSDAEFARQWLEEERKRFRTQKA